MQLAQGRRMALLRWAKLGAEVQAGGAETSSNPVAGFTEISIAPASSVWGSLSSFCVGGSHGKEVGLRGAGGPLPRF